eukprot:TRINITY_DN32892_c0_g1_i1.p1 TRINITY_DN32892_c0_g1~~TRINITY_DN32892_c0_g1_i1.p1  ORF type:complete len:628 (-),score=147.77 TRINITY_DN32892_c0_g1_i1:209-2092(-)
MLPGAEASHKASVTSMWAIYRTSRKLGAYVGCAYHLRLRSAKIENKAYALHIGTASELNQGDERPWEGFRERALSYGKEHVSLTHYGTVQPIRRFSLQPNTKAEEGDSAVEDGLSMLKGVNETQVEGLPLSEDGISEGEADKADEGRDSSEEVKQKTKPLLEILLKSKNAELVASLDRWLDEGNVLNRKEAFGILGRLRRRGRYVKALKVSDWMLEKKILEADEDYYATYLNFTCKVSGIKRAQKYFDHIPSEFRGYRMYRILLANCSSKKHVKKAEEVFHKMKELGFPLEIFDYNQLLFLYKRFDRKKMGQLLSNMEAEGIKPDKVTYRNLIAVKGSTRDITGMEEIIEIMKSEGHEVDGKIQTLLAKHYIQSAMTDKAELAVKEAEKHIENDKRLIGEIVEIYGMLGKTEDVERLSKDMEDITDNGLRLWAYSSQITAWGKLGDVDKAEQLFEKTLSSGKATLSHYNALLSVYADRGFVLKSKELVKKMTEDGLQVAPTTLDALVRLYVNAGELEKADSVFSKICSRKGYRPFYVTKLFLLRSFAKKGEIAKSEKYFRKLKDAGFLRKFALYESLLQAYVNAGMPAYGFKERMIGDNVVATRCIKDLLLKLEENEKKGEELPEFS